MPKQQIKLNTETFIELVNKQPKVLLAFDYDGTLTNLVKDHDGAILSDEEINKLNTLTQLPGTKVAIVTGRAVSNLKFLLNGRLSDKILLYGTHGAEKDNSAYDPEVKSKLNKIKEFFINEPHIYFEEKPISLTIHYKEHPEREVLKSRLLAKATELEDEFRVQQGHDVFEYLPKHINKGIAIRDLHNNHPEYYLVFLGDDLTDNFGFEEINKLNGLAVQVGERIKDAAAGYLIDRVEDTYNLIDSYLEGRKLP
jgi:trehalose 6-phosphate phosphatase